MFPSWSLGTSENGFYYDFFQGDHAAWNILRLTGSPNTNAAHINQLQDQNLEDNLDAGSRRIVTVGSIGNIPQNLVQQYGLLPNHDYEVLDYDFNLQRVRLRNPWNQPGRLGGGKFPISLQDFKNSFDLLCTEASVAPR